MELITPSIEQGRAVKAICSWYTGRHSMYFYLGGFAGSGKSSLIPLIVDALGINPDKVVYGSYVGNAALNMRRKGLVNATTIHGMIYVLEEAGINPDGTPKLTFKKDQQSVARNADLIVIDECSMIDDIAAKDLLSYGTRILVLGDPGQLDPINGTGYFTRNKPDFFLREIHRQALENPIIRYSMLIREGKPLPFIEDGAFRRVRLEEISPEELVWADQIITGKHVSRRELNEYLLELEQLPMTYPTTPGYKVLCMKNNRDFGLVNGMIGRTTEFSEGMHPDPDGKTRSFMQSIVLDDGVGGEERFTDIRMNYGAFEDHWAPRSEKLIALDSQAIMDKATAQQHWDYGYALTVHKAQGSQWDNVILYDDGMLSWDRSKRIKFLYTAATRASKNLIIGV